MPATIFVKNLARYIGGTDYEHCEVIGVTQCKNFNSVVLHEYLHVIIRNPTTRAWCRLLVERQTNQDQVVFGIWPWIAPGSNSGSAIADAPLPLPMRHTTFRQPLHMTDLIDMLNRVHNQKPNYHLAFANCFWYADAVYKALTGGVVTREWVWLVFKKWPLIPGSMLGFGVILIAMRRVAQNFNKQLAGGAQYGSDTAEQSAESESLLELHEEATVLKIMQEYDLRNNLDESAIKEYVAKNKIELQQFTSAVLGNPAKEENLKAYKDTVGKAGFLFVIEQVRVNNLEFTQDLFDCLSTLADGAPSDAEEAAYEEALRVFVGGVFRELPDAPDAV
ncbi:hypothetical protein B0H16DRAFT_1900831 [Mycena metata]|uniref:Uncharacterized protein n=1 Tax=Mycena metata TaxID=1033252 RepID=A0AAD7H1P8_9AGAR|nr:hypothetical protein B0H16DRAFT_1900831 [Mycena metata]